jgi:hypothetical protein
MMGYLPLIDTEHKKTEFSDLVYMALRYDSGTELFYPAGAPRLDPSVDEIESAPELQRKIMFYWKDWEYWSEKWQ